MDRDSEDRERFSDRPPEVPEGDDVDGGLEPRAAQRGRGRFRIPRPAALALGFLLAAGAGAGGATYLGGHAPLPAGVFGTRTSQPNPQAKSVDLNLGPSPSVSAIAAAIDPSVVDINVTLAFGQGSAAGTGIILTSDGQVLTNNHVVEGASTIKVSLPGGKTYSAHVVGVDPSADVALLQMQGASGLTPAPVGDSANVSLGDRVVAIGNALGMNGTPTVVSGAVTALNRSIVAADAGAGSEQLSGLIQTDANLAPGDSGGPLVNASGHVIGMDTAAGQTGRRHSQSTIGFAIPINKALSLVQKIRSGQAASGILIGTQAFLGVEVADAGGASGAPGPSGALVLGVIPGTPAEQAGLGRQDVIVSLGGKPVTSSASLKTVIETFSPGQSVRVVFVDASGQQHTATVALTAGPAA